MITNEDDSDGCWRSVKMIRRLILLICAVEVLDARTVDLCRELNLKNLQKNVNNVVCFNSTDQTLYQVNSLSNTKVRYWKNICDAKNLQLQALLLTYPEVRLENTRLCERFVSGWRCQAIVFIGREKKLVRSKRYIDREVWERKSLEIF